MKSNLKTITTLLFVLFSIIFFSQCEKVLFQSNKPLEDVIADKTWETPGKPETEYMKFVSNGVLVLKDECPMVYSEDWDYYGWYIEGDTIVLTKQVSTGSGYPIQYLYIEKYSKNKISGSYFFLPLNEEGEFVIKSCD